MTKRTKIICTIGPASKNLSTLRAMIAAGMNVARLNFSHGTHADHRRLIKNILAAARAEREPVAILQDLQGPKIRLGVLPKKGVMLKSKQEIIFKSDVASFSAGSVPVFPVTFATLHKYLSPGARVLLDDGLVEVKVTAVKGRAVHAVVVTGGLLTSHKGMNFPDSTLRISSLTEKDKKDVAFGLKFGVHWIALSFVTSAKDVLALRSLIKRMHKKGAVLPRIIAKIEKHEAVKNFDEILNSADGIMVARGDLGVEIPAEDVPIVQKEIIEKCRQAGKPVVVATQMLDSMTHNARPTRAEVSDVANAAIDHADAVMLSGESANGSYPVETVQMMARILKRTEGSAYDDVDGEEGLQRLKGTDEHLISHALVELARQEHIQGILSATFLASWAERLMISRPEVPLYLAADEAALVCQLNIRWGARPFLQKKMSAEKFVKSALAHLRKYGALKSGTRLALVLGGVHGTGFDVIDI